MLAWIVHLHFLFIQVDAPAEVERLQAQLAQSEEEAATLRTERDQATTAEDAATDELAILQEQLAAVQAEKLSMRSELETTRLQLETALANLEIARAAQSDELTEALHAAERGIAKAELAKREAEAERDIILVSLREADAKVQGEAAIRKQLEQQIHEQQVREEFRQEAIAVQLQHEEQRRESERRSSMQLAKSSARVVAHDDNIDVQSPWSHLLQSSRLDKARDSPLAAV